MAFNFTGTFTTGQWLSLYTFSKYQQQDLAKRIKWLEANLERVGTFTTAYDSDNFPASYSVNPPDSYGAKLLTAYKVLGGNPELDFIIRTKDQPVFKERGVPLSNDTEDHTTGYSELYSNGVRERGIRYDMDVGIRTDRAKSWMLSAIKRKREYLEYKIKKCLDLSDQIQHEIKLLKSCFQDPGRIDDQVMQIMAVATIPGAANVVANSDDVHGNTIGDTTDVTSSQDIDQGAAAGKRGAPNPLDNSIDDALTGRLV